MANTAMKKTFLDKLREKVNGWYRKNPALRPLYKAFVVVVLFFYHIVMHFAGNGKKYLCGIAVVVVFIANGSFTFYGNGEVIHAEAASNSDIALVTEKEVETADILPEEADPTAYGSGDYQVETTEDSFTLEDIWDEHATYLEQEDAVIPTDNSYNNLSFDKDDWRIILVNKQHPIPDDYEFELAVIKDWMMCDSRILENLLLMMKDASKDGYTLAINSPYRRMSDQVFLFDRKINKFMDLGMSYMDAYKTSAYSVTVPGASEHQLGLALDLVAAGHNVLSEAFGETGEGIWLRDNSYKYGFILRYPKGKEHITGIEYEPWHFRYVGVEAATIIYENDLCLEEFWEEYVY